jgi:hypothetical protein
VVVTTLDLLQFHKLKLWVGFQKADSFNELAVGQQEEPSGRTRDTGSSHTADEQAAKLWLV